jgi:hypothetical protein
MVASGMKEVSAALAGWLDQQRRKDQNLAAVLAVLALGSAVGVFLFLAFALYMVLATVGSGVFQSNALSALVAAGAATCLFAYGATGRRDEHQLGMDPGGLWIFKELFSIGPRLLLEGLRQVRCSGQLRELNVAACAQALDYLARHDAPVDWRDLAGHGSFVAGPRLREQLSLLHGVLFLGEDAARVTLMEPFRLRLRAMLEFQPRDVEPEPPPRVATVTDPELLGAYEILGLSPSASAAEIKAAYRKRVKECHPDLFAGMDDRARAMAERWTRALNAAYAALKPRHGLREGSSGRH